MNGRRFTQALLVTSLSACALGGAAQRAPAPVSRPSFEFAAARIAQGAELAEIGNCRTCHTSEGGAAFAGGRPLPTPFGTIFSTNITPDAATGIGGWSAEEFRRAMHEGVDRKGRHLYPVFPYDHFTRLTDDDVAALYAFVMTREAVQARPPRNRLAFPANVRPLLAAWKWMYFNPGRYIPDPGRTAEWNRGAYLVEGLAHCGACHTPRNAAGAEDKRDALGGGEAEGWLAPALAAASRAPVPWTVDALVTYLRTGFDAQHGLAAGPMAPVADSLATVPQADVRAIAVYLTDMSGEHAASAPASRRTLDAAQAREFDAIGRHHPDRASEARQSAALDQAGETIFAGACATCHFASGAMPFSKPVPLALATSVNATTPRNALRIVAEGLHPQPGESGAIMPSFSGALTDAQIVAVVQYMRARFSDGPRWDGVDVTLRKLREEQRK